MSMNPKIKAQWLAALRSGEYQQGKGALRRTIQGEEKFCCLGVLCELAVKAEVTPAPVVDSHQPTLAAWQYENGNWGSLPPSVRDWAGLLSVDPSVIVTSGSANHPVRHEQNLSECNDDLRLTFAQIADVIEAQL